MPQELKVLAVQFTALVKLISLQIMLFHLLPTSLELANLTLIGSPLKTTADSAVRYYWGRLRPGGHPQRGN